MSGKIWIIYDCPRAKCSKEWIRDELEKRGYTTRPIYCKWEISHIEQRGEIGKLIARLLTLFTCIYTTILSRQNDLVICWSNIAGLYFNILPSNAKKNIISYNWLTPTPRRMTLFLYQKALRNKRLHAIVNEEGNKNRLLEQYQVEDVHNIHCIHDVYDSAQPFVEPLSEVNRQNRYCFMGGRANRDWDMFLHIAEHCPDIRFVGIAASSDWNYNRSIPNNVEMYFDQPASQYYMLLEHAYITIYPLKDCRVAGLVNIVKSIQMGKLVLVTDIPATRMYYTSETEENLIQMCNLEQWVDRIYDVFSDKYTRYEEDVRVLQNNLKQVFSPQYAGEELHSIIRKVWNVHEAKK